MNRYARIALILAAPLFVLAACGTDSTYTPKAGDVLFQDLASDQSQAIKLATGSEYTHAAIVFEEEGEFVVCEAVGPVRIIPLDDWIAQGVEGHFVAKRLLETAGDLSQENLSAMRQVGERHLGKAYDLVFDWSDDKLYCSELVWKIYTEGGGLTLTTLRELGEYDLSHPVVAAKAEERYGDSIPLDMPVVAPSDLFDSELLELVYQN